MLIKIPFPRYAFLQQALEKITEFYQHRVFLHVFLASLSISEINLKASKICQRDRLLILANETNFLTHLFAYSKAIQPNRLLEKLICCLPFIKSTLRN